MICYRLGIVQKAVRCGYGVYIFHLMLKFVVRLLVWLSHRSYTFNDIAVLIFHDIWAILEKTSSKIKRLSYITCWTFPRLNGREEKTVFAVHHSSINNVKKWVTVGLQIVIPYRSSKKMTEMLFGVLATMTGYV